MKNFIVFSLALLCLFSLTSSQFFSNVSLSGTVIGNFSTSFNQCTYWCQNQYIAGCIGYTFDPNSSICQYFSSVFSIQYSTTRNGVFFF